jgi:hypothetical protein
MSAYEIGPADAEGAKSTVRKLLDIARTNDDAAYDKLAKGMVLMLAPDMGGPIDRARFQHVLAACTAPLVVSSRPFPKTPQVQAVRITMKCTDRQHPVPGEASADIMADNQHAFMILPGGVEAIWPDEARH